MAPRDLTARYIQLANELGDEMGRPRGWRLRAAEKLGIDAPTLSRVLRGNRQVGWDLAERAVERLRLPRDYFTNPAAKKSSKSAAKASAVRSGDGQVGHVGHLVHQLQSGTARQADVYALARAVAESDAVKRAKAIIKTPPPRNEQEIGALFVSAARLVEDLKQLLTGVKHSERT